jgi:Mg/Co/Ni transporter MgtE
MLPRRRRGKDPSKTPVRDIMTKEMVSCSEDEDCIEAARLMKNAGVRRLTVVDRKQAIVGLLSVDDLARCSHDLAGEVLEAVRDCGSLSEFLLQLVGFHRRIWTVARC